MKKLLVLFLSGIASIQCMQKECLGDLLTTQLKKKIENSYTEKAIVDRFNSRSYLEDEDYYVNYFKSVVEFCEIDDSKISDFSETNEETGLNLLELQCLSGYKKAATYLKDQGFEINNENNLFNEVDNLQKKNEKFMQENYSPLDSYKIKPRLKDIFQMQMQAINAISPKGSTLQTKCLLNCLHAEINDLSRKEKENNVMDMIAVTGLTKDNLSDAYFYNSSKSGWLNILAYSIVKGLPECTELLLNLGVDPYKMNEDSLTPEQVFEKHLFDSSQFEACIVWKKFTVKEKLLIVENDKKVKSDHKKKKPRRKKGEDNEVPLKNKKRSTQRIMQL